MTEAFELVVRQARLRSHPDELMDIGIAEGHIAAISTRLDGAADQVVDAAGNLVTESFVNPHLHLFKVYTHGNRHNS